MRVEISPETIKKLANKDKISKREKRLVQIVVVNEIASNKKPIAFVCTKLGIDPQLIYKWKAQETRFSLEVQEALDYINEVFKDMAEAVIIDKIHNGKSERSAWRFLEMKGKDRGYSKQHLITVDDKRALDSDADKEIYEEFKNTIKKDLIVE